MARNARPSFSKRLMSITKLSDAHPQPRHLSRPRRGESKTEFTPSPLVGEGGAKRRAKAYGPKTQSKNSDLDPGMPCAPRRSPLGFWGFVVVCDVASTPR